MNKKNTLDLSDVFFESLEYPVYARANFFLNKQKETDWRKGVYLTALHEVYHHSMQVLHIKFNGKKAKDANLKFEDFKITIKDLTGLENNKIVDKKILDEILYTLQNIPYFDREPNKFTLYEIISCVEAALLFIKKEFYEQTKKANSHLPRPRTQTYFTYLIAQDGPFFNFPKFKETFRELLYTAANIDKVEKIFISFHKAAVEIVNMWNGEIYFLEQNTHFKENGIKSECVRVEFHLDTLSHTWWSNEKIFDNSIPHSHFFNQDFASYAANIANLINAEIIHGKPTKLKELQKNFLNDFIEGIQHLQIQNENEIAIKNILEKKLLEAPFRNFFSTWFSAKKYDVNSESLRGSKHIDLKVEHPSIDKKIIEFKGWWNPHKANLIPQIFNYLTQFEDEGYIFIINYTDKEIYNDYKELICKTQTGYLARSWKKLRFKRSSFYYFQSSHTLDTSKAKIYHLIFNVHKPRNIH